MRAYRKTTQHPYCIYFTTEELEKVLRESEGVDPEYTPWWAKVIESLEKVYDKPVP